MLMDCGQVTTFFDRASPAERRTPPVEVRAHLDRCKPCRAIWEFLTEPGVAEVSPETQQKIEHTLLDTLEPVKPIAGRGVLALGFLCIFGLVSAGIIGYMGIQGAAMMTSLQLAGLLAAFLVSVVLASIALSGEMSPGDRRWLPPGRQIAATLLAITALCAVLFPWELSQGWMSGTWHCFRDGFLYSLPAAGLAIALLGRGAVLSWPRVGAGAGLLAGLVGATALHLGCTMQTAPHILVGHLAIPAIGALAGYGIGRLLPSIWSARRAT